jgi:hypothetical protein
LAEDIQRAVACADIRDRGAFGQVFEVGNAGVPAVKGFQQLVAAQYRPVIQRSPFCEFIQLHVVLSTPLIWPPYNTVHEEVDVNRNCLLWDGVQVHIFDFIGVYGAFFDARA